MLGFVLFLAFQAADPPVPAVAEAPATPAAAAVAASADEQPAQPERKKVCRTTLDNRVGLIAKTRKVCRFVDADPSRPT